MAGRPAATRPHDLRDALATTLLGRGVHRAIASAALGHSAAGFTMSVYQHLTDAMTAQATEAIDQALGGSSPR